MAVTQGKTVGYALVGNCIIYVGAKKPPTEADWTEYIQWLKQKIKPGGQVQSVIFERGSGPSAAQRQILNAVSKSWSLRVAVIAPSAIARGIVTALTWFKEGYKAFSPEEVDAAVRFVGVPALMTEEVKRTIRGLEQEMDKP